MNKKTKQLLRINNEMDKRLTKENNKVMTDIICYLRSANVSEYYQEVIRQDLLEMVLSAQERGESIQTVVGMDYKAFCDEVIENAPQMNTKEKFLDLLDTLLLSLSIITAINVFLSKETFLFIRNIATGRPVDFQMDVTVGKLLSIAIIAAAAIIVFRFISKRSFKSEKNFLKSWWKNFLISFSVTIVLVFIIWAFQSVLFITLFSIHLIAAFVIILLLYAAHRFLQKTIK